MSKLFKNFFKSIFIYEKRNISNYLLVDFYKNPCLTLAIMDDDCEIAYVNWKKDNKNKIAWESSISDMKIHIMKKESLDDKDEFVVVISSSDLKFWKIDLNKFNLAESKLLLFGKKSIKKSKNLKERFLKSKVIDVSEECLQ